MLGLACSCAYSQKPAPTNLTDYHFIRESQARASASGEFNARRALDGVLDSRCKWLPSDSEFYEATARSCGPLKAAFLAMGRTLEEPDIALDSMHPVVNDGTRLRWVHMPLECAP